MKSLPTVSELERSYNDFAYFTLSLLEEAEQDAGKLKVAVVTAQIAVELFLKFIFVAEGKTLEIQKLKGSAPANEFKEFDTILNHFVAQNRFLHGNKSDIVTLLQNRNAIVHSGQNRSDDKELACIIVASLFFIHAVQYQRFSTQFFSSIHQNPKKGRLVIWQEGVSRFIESCRWLDDADVTTCLDCRAKTVIPADLFPLRNEEDEEMLVCMTCFESIDTKNQAVVIECYNCGANTYIVDFLNEQERQLYVGKCTECEEDRRVRKCAWCDTFYHPSTHNEITLNGCYYCSSECAGSVK